MKLRLIAVPAATLAGMSLPAAAQEQLVLEPIVVETLRPPAAEASVPESVVVIEGDDIIREAGGDLPRYLGDRVPGFSQANGTISDASQTLRGRNYQVLVNGVPRVSQLRGFSRDLALIDPASIARVEIIKGATALYGNGAPGGIVNIITRAADEEGLGYGGLALLSFNDQNVGDSLATDVSAYTQFRNEAFGLRVDFAGSFTGDTFDGAGRLMPSDPLIGQGGGDNLTRYALSATADYTVGDHEFTFYGTAAHLSQDIDFNPDYTTDPVTTDLTSPYTGEDPEDDTQTFSLNYRNGATPLGELRVTAFYSHSDRRAAFVPLGPANPLVYFSGDPLDPQDPDAQSVLETEQYGLRTALTNDVGSASVTVGVDYQHDHVGQTILDGREIIAPMRQDSIAGFAQVDLPVGERIDLRAGMRYEKFFLDVEDFTRPEVFQLGVPVPLPAVEVTGGSFDYDALVFNIGGVLHATDAVDLFAGFNQGFSIPDVGAFTRRAMNPNPFDPTPVSFASIQPEAAIVNSYELGVRYDEGWLHGEAAGFVSTSEEGTTFDPATNEITQQEEIIWGAELTVAADVRDDLSLGAALGYQEGRYDSDGDGDIDAYLPNNRIVSPFTGTIYGDYAVTPRLSLGGEVVYTAGRDRDPAFELEDTFIVDLHGSYDLGPGTVYAGVWNLFDRDQLNPTATSVRNIPIADEGRRIWVGYSVRF